MTQHPTLPSSFTKLRPASRARVSAQGSASRVAVGFDFWKPKELVVVDADLRVDRLDLPRRRGDQRVDLAKRRSVLLERLVELRHDLGALLDQARRVEQGVGQPIRLMWKQTEPRVYAELADGVGVGNGYLFDVDPSLARHHEKRRLRGPIDQDAYIRLGVDVLRRGDQNLSHREPADGQAQNGFGMTPGLFGRGRELDSPGLPSASRVHLGFDDHRSAKLTGDLLGFVRDGSHRPGGTGIPASRKSSFAWNSCRFIPLPVV